MADRTTSDPISIRAEPRSLLGKQVKRLRQEGWVPAVLYGHGVESHPLQIELHHLRNVIQAGGLNRLVPLQVGDDEPRLVLGREVQRDPISHRILHVDLQAVVMSEEITVEVPLVLVGESSPVVRREAMLLRGVDTVEIQCLPEHLIEAIEVPIDGLAELDQAIEVGELQVDPRVKILADPDDLVVKLIPAFRAPEEEELAVEALEIEGEDEAEEAEEAPEAETEAQES
ncbi:MAG: 50S ribosomal protein L25 [Anaerolineae bacterium]